MDLSEVKQLPKVDHTPAVLDEISRLMLRAADILETGGHCKGRSADGSRHCLSGALTQATFDLKMENKTHFDAAARLYPHIGNVVAWNDDEDRTQAEVVAKLRAVALGL